MTFQTSSTENPDSRERLIRVEERLKHMDETQGIALRELKIAISELQNTAREELVETRSRLTALEKRVDKIYWLWSAAVFVGTPVMMVISKVILGQFGVS